MNTGAPTLLRRSVVLAAAGILVVVLAACTGRGGGYLPPGPTASERFPATVFAGQASFGFSFSCEDKGGLNTPTGQLGIQLSYTERGTSDLNNSPFSIHGIADIIDPVLESAVCIAQNPPPGLAPNELIFLGRYYLTSSAPEEFPPTCPTRETTTSPLCRFEVMVRDNDRNLAPSTGDFFSIKLSNVTASCDAPTLDELDPTCSQLPAAAVFYARAGFLEGGNLTVD